MGDLPINDNEKAQDVSPAAVEVQQGNKTEEQPQQLPSSLPPTSGAPSPYSAFSPPRRRLILGIVTAAGFFGPLSGGIYLPALPLFGDIFSTSPTVINATVSVYMLFFAIAVSF